MKNNLSSTNYIKVGGSDRRFSITFCFMLTNKIINTINKHNLIEPGDHILVGLSGGQDSIFMLDILLKIKEDLDFDISIGHFNHKVRGKLADRDQKFCKDLSKELGLDFYTSSHNMDDYAQELSISSEEAGRLLRKDFFAKTSKDIGANKTALAHNKDDQVETVLMRIIRGTGIDGLEGIEYKSGPIIRPILDISRREIEEHIRDQDLAYVEDHTNFENIYHRNKIRNILIPLLEEEYNPEIKNSIHNLSRLASMDKNYLLKESDQAYKNILIKEGPTKIIINRYQLNNLDLALASRIIRKIFKKLCGYINDISLKNVKDILDLAKGQTGKVINNISGLSISNSYEQMIFDKSQDSLEEINYYKKLELGINIIYNDLSFYLEKVDRKSEDSSLYIPKDIIKGDLVIRNRRPGDRIKLPNMEGSKKVKDIFIDDKIPRSQRDKYLIIADDERIYCLVDLRMGDVATSNSNHYIKITKINGGEDA